MPLLQGGIDPTNHTRNSHKYRFSRPEKYQFEARMPPWLPAGTAHACRTASYCLRFFPLCTAPMASLPRNRQVPNLGFEWWKELAQVLQKLGPLYLEAAIFKLGQRYHLLSHLTKTQVTKTICLCHLVGVWTLRSADTEVSVLAWRKSSKSVFTASKKA